MRNVIWPAVAGNILWAFLSVAADPNSTGMSMWTKLVALLAIGIYLSRDLIERVNVTFPDVWKYISADVLLATALAAFAIATQLDRPWWGWVLACAFLIAIVGHCAGSWNPNEEAKAPNSCTRAKFAMFNAIGLVILGGGLLTPFPYAFFPPAAIGLVVVLFIISGVISRKGNLRTLRNCLKG